MEVRRAVVYVSQLGCGGELEFVYRDTGVCVSNRYDRRDADSARVRVGQIQDSNAG